jgi:WD40 repeat protein
VTPRLDQRGLMRGVARVWRAGPDGIAAEVVGTAMLVAPRHLLTCAHVVAASQGHAADADEPPSRPALVDLPALAPGRLLRARVDVWWPRQPRPGGVYDIAGLTLIDDPPAGAESVPLVVVEGAWERPVRAFGFPTGRPDGSYAAGTVRDLLANGWVMLRGGAEAREFTRPGYSGGPVYDDGGVLGMLTEGDRDHRVREAVMIPTEALLAGWPALGRRLRANPYPGLVPFTAEQAHLFFGRRGVAAELLDELRRPPHVRVLAGASGGGKSSLLQAGLAQVGGDGWRVLRFAPGRDPHDALARALLRHAGSDLAPSERLREAGRLRDLLAATTLGVADALCDLLPHEPTGARHLLALDQAEELVMRSGWPEENGLDATTRGRALPLGPKRVGGRRHAGDAAVFLQGLVAALADPRLAGRVALLLAVRTDHLDTLLALPALAGLHARAPVVRYLGPVEDLREVITGPLRRAGTVRAEPGLVDRLLDDVAGQANPLPLLAFTLRELWLQQHAGRLTHGAYDALGGVASALAGFAQACYEEFDEDDRRRVRDVLVQLAQPMEGRAYARRVAPLTAFGGAEIAVLDRLADRRLVVIDAGAAGESSVAVVHEALFEHWPALRGWLDDAWAFRRWQEGLRHAIVDWRAWGEDPLTLPRGARLAQAERFLVSHGERLSVDERAFLGRAIEHRDEEVRREQARMRRERRGQRLLTGVLGVALALVLGLAGLAGWAWDRAVGAQVAARERAEAVAQANDRLAALAMDMERHLGGATEALAAQIGAHALLVGQGTGDAAPDPGLASLLAVQAARLQPGGASHDALLRTLQAHPRFARRLPVVATGLAAHAAGGLLAGTASGELAWFPVAGEATRVAGHRGPVGAVAVDAGARLAASGGDDGELRLWTLPGLVPHGEPWRGHTMPVRWLVFEERGRWLASVDLEGTIRVWEVASGALAATLQRGTSGAPAIVPAAPDNRARRDEGIPVAGSAATFDAAIEGAHGAWLRAVAFDPMGDWLAWASNDGRVVFAAPERGWAAVAVADLGAEVGALVALPGGSGVVVGLVDGSLARVTADGAVARLPLRPHHGPIADLAVSPDGASLIVLEAAAGVAHVVGAMDGGRLQPPLGGIGPAPWFAAVQQGWVVTAAGAGSVTRWHQAVPDPLVRRVAGRDALPAALAVSGDGRVAVGWHDGALEVHALAGDAPPLRRPAAHTDAIHALHANWSAGTLLSAGRDGQLLLSSLSDLQPIGAPVWSHHEPLWSIVVAAGDRGVWVGGVQGVAQRWSGSVPEPVERLDMRSGLLWTPAPEVHEAEGGLLRAVRLRYDVTVTRAGARVWSSDDAPGGDVYAIAFDAGGERLLAQRDGHLEVREAEGLALLGRVPAPANEAFAVDAAGRWLAVVDREGRPQLFDAASLRPVGAPLQGASGRAHRLAFSPDGRTLVAAGESGDIDAWDVDPEAWIVRACARSTLAGSGSAWAGVLEVLGSEPACRDGPTGGSW